MRLASKAFVRFSLPFPAISDESTFPYGSDTGSAVVDSIEAISMGLRVGSFCKRMATAPDTCGAAKLVPLVRLYFPPLRVVFTNAPGATKSGFM